MKNKTVTIQSLGNMHLSMIKEMIQQINICQKDKRDLPNKNSLDKKAGHKCR